MSAEHPRNHQARVVNPGARGVLHRHPANRDRHDHRDLGDRAADRVTRGMGSWAFIGAQTVVIVAWIVLNIIALVRHWDPAPFILLNLIFSVQSAYASPLILLAQNRQTEHDRLRAEEDYQTNNKALAEIKAVREDLAKMLR